MEICLSVLLYGRCFGWRSVEELVELIVRLVVDGQQKYMLQGAALTAGTAGLVGG